MIKKKKRRERMKESASTKMNNWTIVNFFLSKGIINKWIQRFYVKERKKEKKDSVQNIP